MINQIYQNILREILNPKNKLSYETPKYGGKTSNMLIHPNNGYVAFSLDNSISFPLINLRDIKSKVFVAEMIWYLSGSKNPNWLQKYTKIWNAFADEDGQVSSSYGYRWRYHFGRDQLLEAVNLLKKDPTNRQAIIVTWDPAKDGLDSVKQKNVPCVPMLQLLVLDQKLVMNLVWRSNDLYLGFPHDVSGFCLLQRILAQKMNLKVGNLNYTILHGHLYENQLENAQKLLKVKPQNSEINLILPKNSFDIARSNNETEMDKIFEQIFEQIDSQYKPLQKLNNVKIVV
jgi:thymidylate synthase